MGTPPPNPHENKKIRNCPGLGKLWGLRPQTPTRNNVPGPDQFGAAHVGQDTTRIVTYNQSLYTTARILYDIIARAHIVSTG